MCPSHPCGRCGSSSPADHRKEEPRRESPSLVKQVETSYITPATAPVRRSATVGPDPYFVARLAETAVLP
jgi:hypothetical protein